jgi:hypothetical protein
MNHAQEVQSIGVLRGWRLPCIRPHKASARAQLALSLICALALGLLMACIAYRLFGGITVIGMQGVDTFEYWKYADEILRGQINFIVDRLSFYVLNVLAMKALGLNDFAMRAFIAAAAVMNIGIVYCLSYRVLANAAIALAVASIYAFNPTVLFYSSTELPHVYGATFVLLAAVFALFAVDLKMTLRTRYVSAGLTGFLIAGAAFSHEDLIFVAVAFALIIGLMSPREGLFLSRSTVQAVLLVETSVAVGFVLGLAWPMLALGVGPMKVVHDFFAVQSSMDQNTAVRTGNSFLRMTVPRIMENIAADLLEPRLASLTAITMVSVPLIYALRRLEQFRSVVLLQAVVVVFLFLFVVVGRVFLEGNYRRIFIPIVGLVVVFTVCGSYALVQLLCRTFLPRPWPAIFATLLVGAASAFVIAGYKPAAYQQPPLSIHRAIYNALRADVAPDRRLLVPTCFSYGMVKSWVGLGSNVYFGSNVVSLAQSSPERVQNFDRFVARYSVRYVLVLKQYELPIMPIEDVKLLFAVFYGVDLPKNIEETIKVAPQNIFPNETRVMWSGEACQFETEVLRRILIERDSRLIMSLPIADIYELPERRANT